MRRFRDRDDAAARVIAALPQDMGRDWLVLALPRGGAPIAAALARRLGAELDVLGVRKVGAPGRPEVAVGAVTGPGAEDFVVNDDLAAALGLGRDALAARAREAAAELARRRAGWAPGRPPPAMAGRRVLIVDDGVATGATLLAAVEAARRAGAAEVAVAVPVALGDALQRLAARADRVICPWPDAALSAVSQAYLDFPQVSDATVARLLAEAARAPRPD